MKTHLTTLLVLVTVVGWTAHDSYAATNGPSGNDDQPAEDEAALELKEHHQHHHLGGVTQFVAMSLDTLGVGDARAERVDALQTTLHSCMSPAGEIERELLLTLADGVAAGSVDSAKVDATITRLDVAVTAVHDCSVAPLNQLHAVLSPTERGALVDKILAHWEVWLEVNHEPGGGGRTQGDHVAHLGRKLGLTTLQVDQISESLQRAHAGLIGKWDLERAEVQVRAFATSFLSRTFDANTVTADADAQVATNGSMRMAVFFEAVSPVLTPDQRATLAAELREHARQQPTLSAN